MSNNPDLWALFLIMLVPFIVAAAAWAVHSYLKKHIDRCLSSPVSVEFKTIPGEQKSPLILNEVFFTPEQKAVAKVLKIITTIAGPGRCLYIRNEAAQIDPHQIYALSQMIPSLQKVLEITHFIDDPKSKRFFGFSDDVIVSEALSLFGMIDTEQMSRTINAVRSLMKKHHDLAARAGVA